MFKNKKKFMSTNITTAYHILVEENSNLNDTSVFSATFVVFFSMLSLPSMVSSATNSHVLNVVRHVESIKKTCMSTTIAAACHIKLKNSNQSNTSYLSLTFLVSFSMLSLPPTVSSTTSSHVLNVVKHVETFINFHVNHHHHIVSQPSRTNSN